MVTSHNHGYPKGNLEGRLEEGLWGTDAILSSSGCWLHRFGSVCENSLSCLLLICALFCVCVILSAMLINV